MHNSIKDRIISALSYLTFGFFGLIWLIFSTVIKKHTSQFAMFNIFQSIFLSIVLAIFAKLYEIAMDLLASIPFLNNIAKSTDIFLNNTPIIFSYTPTEFIVTVLAIYLILLSLLGKKPYLPFISNITNVNFGG